MIAVRGHCPLAGAPPRWLLVVLFLAGCIDPIDLEVGAPKGRLVVEALVREGGGPHYVVLSRSAAYTQGIDALRPRERGATVSVRVGSGGEVPFEEVAGERYEPAPVTLVGEVGETYTLSVTLADGTAWASTPEVMRAAPAIGALYAELEPHPEVVGGVLVQRQRVALYVDVEPAPDRADLYRLTWTGTYAIASGFSGAGTCYRRWPVEGFTNVGTTASTSGAVLPRQRAGDVSLFATLPDITGAATRPVSGWAFLRGFQVRAELQALGPESHHYWRQVAPLTENVGSLFDPPPDDAAGNVARRDDPTEVALGHFTVAGIAAATMCVQRAQFAPEWPTLPQPFFLAGIPCGSPQPPPEWRAACEGGAE
jgi:hypothetical protein